MAISPQAEYAYDRLDRVHWHPPLARVFVPVLIVARIVLRATREHPSKACMELTDKNGDANYTVWVNWGAGFS